MCLHAEFLFAVLGIFLNYGYLQGRYLLLGVCFTHPSCFGGCASVGHFGRRVLVSSESLTRQLDVCGGLLRTVP